MNAWVHLNAQTTVFYPGKSLATQAGSRTTTAAASATLNASITTIKSVQVGATNTAGTLTIADHAGTTVREFPVPAASTSNMGINQGLVAFDIPSGFRVSCSSVTTDLYVQYEFVNKWPVAP